MKARFIHETLDFIEDQDPYKALGVGRRYNVKVGDKIKILGDPNSIKAKAMWPKPNMIIIITKVEDNRNLEYQMVPYDNNTFYLSRDWLPDHEWEFVSINESLSFEEDMDPYDALNVGSIVKNETVLNVITTYKYPDVWYIKKYDGDMNHYYMSNTMGQFPEGMVQHIGESKKRIWYNDLNDWLHGRGQLKPGYFDEASYLTVSGEHKNGVPFYISKYNENSSVLIDLIKTVPANAINVKYAFKYLDYSRERTKDIEPEIIEQFKRFIK